MTEVNGMARGHGNDERSGVTVIIKASSFLVRHSRVNGISFAINLTIDTRLRGYDGRAWEWREGVGTTYELGITHTL